MINLCSLFVISLLFLEPILQVFNSVVLTTNETADFENCNVFISGQVRQNI